jgi:hypothetical protein
MISRRAFSLLLSLFVAFSTCIFVQGQSTYGSITGMVTDPSGAAIGDARVTLTNLGTAEKRVQPTGSDGLYSFVNLIPGNYRIEVEKQGFKRITQEPVVVQVQQSSKIDVALPIGQATETIEVTSETPLLQSETSSLGQVVEQRKANELPLNGRNIYSLAAVAPSVIPQGSTTGSPVGKNPFDFANYQIGGSFANQSAEYLDGQPLNIGYINLPLLTPTQDSIGEFKVQYNNLGPEWGKFSGGVINLSTKSGTNKFHGSAYEYLRNKVFNSNEYFLKGSQIANGLKNEPPPFTQNQYGATFGGPAIKDKTFFFFSWEAYRLRSGTVFSTIVPTAAERTGDFSAAGVPTIFDPLSVDPGCAPGAICARTAFAGNVIPAGRLNPTSQFLLGFIPLPTNPAAAPGSPNFIKATSTGGNVDEYVGRVDQNINASNRVFGRFSYWKLLSLAQDPFGTGFCKDRCSENTRSKSLAVGITHTFSPTTIADFNISISRFHYLRLPINSNFDMTQEGWPAAYNGFVPDTERTPLTPCFAVSDPTVTCSQGQSSINDFNTQWNFSPQVTMIRGRHTFVWGGQLEEGYDNYLQTNTGGGLISFGGSWTSSQARNASTATGGVDYADFLLGYGLGQGAAFGNQTTGSLVISGPVSGKQTYRAFYFGDNWHVTSKLTVNLGVRYELQGPWSERFDKMTYFDPAVSNSSVTGCSGVAGSACPGDLFLVKTGSNTSRNNLPLSYKEILPRAGFAYSFDQKTVIRGGYGVFFIPNYVSFGTNPYIDPVSSATSNFFASNNQGLFPASTLGPTATDPNSSTCHLDGTGGAANFHCDTVGPFGPNLVAVAGRNPQPNVSQYAVNASNFSATAFNQQKYGYVEQWNFGIQRELPGGFFADVAYAGSHGVHLEQFNTNVNQIPDRFISQAAQQAAAGLPVAIAQKVCPTQPCAAGLYPFNQDLPGSLGPAGLTVGQLNRPFPQYGGLNYNGFGCCGSSYNSLQATVTKRFQGGGTLLVAYTNAKLMSNTDTLTSWLEGGTTGGVGGVQDWNNLAGERSLSSQDVSQRLVASYVLDLPFGRGKKFLNGVSGVTSKVVSGWGIDGITTFQRGFPLKISFGSQGTSLSGAGLGIGGLRPSVVPGCDKQVSGSPTSKLGGWFNTNCFAPAPDWGFGDESRVDSSLRQQGITNFDWAVFKKTSIGEWGNIEFRTEFFNLFNHPQFGPPNTNCCFDPTTGNGNKSFGTVTSTVGNAQARLIQFALKFEF